jgi:hypothetical protein
VQWFTPAILAMLEEWRERSQLKTSLDRKFTPSQQVKALHSDTHVFPDSSYIRIINRKIMVNAYLGINTKPC